MATYFAVWAIWITRNDSSAKRRPGQRRTLRSVCTVAITPDGKWVRHVYCLSSKGEGRRQGVGHTTRHADLEDIAARSTVTDIRYAMLVLHDPISLYSRGGVRVIVSEASDRDKGYPQQLAPLGPGEDAQTSNARLARGTRLPTEIGAEPREVSPNSGRLRPASRSSRCACRNKDRKCFDREVTGRRCAPGAPDGAVVTVGFPLLLRRVSIW